MSRVRFAKRKEDLTESVDQILHFFGVQLFQFDTVPKLKPGVKPQTSITKLPT